MKIDTAQLSQRWRSILAWAAIALGALVLTLGWFGVSGQTLVAKQLPYLISGGIGGLALLGVGVGLLVAEDVRAERARVGRLEAEMLEVRDLLRTLVDQRSSRAG